MNLFENHDSAVRKCSKIAEAHNIRVHIFYDKGKSNISAMLNGNSYFNIHPYETEDEICPLIDTILHKEQRL